jgi:Tol biopolymer transport system component
VPPSLGSLIMQLLEKNPADRPQSADEVRRALDSLPAAAEKKPADELPAATPTMPVRSAARSTERSVLWAYLGAIVLAGIAGGAMLARSGRTAQPRRPVVAALAAPLGHELRPEGGLALSPDDAKLAFTAADRNGVTAVWVRPLDSLAAIRIEGTEGASGPFWSPDGSALGYFAGGQLRVTDLKSGARRALCPAPRAGGGTWTSNGVIVYSPDFLSVPLFQVPAGGGSCTPLTRFRAGESVHRRPSALPDGRHIIFSNGRTGATSIVMVDLATGALTDVLRSAADAQFVHPDWLLFREGGMSGTLYAQRFDLGALRLRGEPRVVLNRVVGLRTLPSYTASPNVLVALQMNSGQQSLVWVNRKSVVVDSVLAATGAAPYFGASSAALAHDGRRIAFAAAGPMWLYDRDRDVATRAHTATLPDQGILEPAWDPGDSLIAYRTLFSGRLMLRLHHVDTDVSDSLFSLGMRNLRTPDWSPDGRRIAFQLSAGDSAPNDEIWIYSLTNRSASRAWGAPGNLSSPRWSPDGRRLAYVSDETGAPEVYIRALSSSSVAARVSTAGGEFPFWRADGRELYYRAPDGAIMAVGVRLGPKLVLSSPSVVLSSPPFSRTVRSFEATPDGERFIGFGREDPLLFTLVTNWPARVGR